MRCRRRCDDDGRYLRVIKNYLDIVDWCRFRKVRGHVGSALGTGFGDKLYLTVFLGGKVSQQIGSPIAATNLGNHNLVSSHSYFSIDLIMAKLVWPLSSKPVVTWKP